MRMLSRLRHRRKPLPLPPPAPKRQQPRFGPNGKRIWHVALSDNFNSELVVEADRLARAPDGTLLALDNDLRLGYPTGARFVCRAGRWWAYTDRKTQLMAKIVRSGNISHESGLTVRKASIARAKPFQWAWDQRILLSYVNILMGEEGVGKGNLIAWVLARITRGELPGNLTKPRKVVVIGDEDSFDHIWGPRLHVAGADLDLVEHIVTGKNKGVFDVRTDADALRTYINKERIALVYIDQLLDNLGATDNWKDKQVRDALAPLRTVATETKVAVLGAMHPNKRKGSFRDRLAGTPQFNAVSRSSLLVAPHPTEPGRIAVVLGKGNYASEHFAFEFRIEGRELVLTGSNGKKRTIKTSCITDERITTLTRDELLDHKGSRRREDSKAGLARRLLQEMFADGQERSAGLVQKELYDKHKLSSREVTRASEELDFDKTPRGFPAEWYWRVKNEDDSGASE
jgi:hypothetical protein